MRALIILALLLATLSGCTNKLFVAKDYGGSTTGVFPIRTPSHQHHNKDKDEHHHRGEGHGHDHGRGHNHDHDHHGW